LNGINMANSSAPELLAAKRRIIDNMSWRLAYPSAQARVLSHA